MPPGWANGTSRPPIQASPSCHLLRSDMLQAAFLQVWQRPFWWAKAKEMETAALPIHAFRERGQQQHKGVKSLLVFPLNLGGGGGSLPLRSQRGKETRKHLSDAAPSLCSYQCRSPGGLNLLQCACYVLAFISKFIYTRIPNKDQRIPT